MWPYVYNFWQGSPNYCFLAAEVFYGSEGTRTEDLIVGFERSRLKTDCIHYLHASWGRTVSLVTMALKVLTLHNGLYLHVEGSGSDLLRKPTTFASTPNQHPRHCTNSSVLTFFTSLFPVYVHFYSFDNQQFVYSEGFVLFKRSRLWIVDLWVLW